MDNNKNEQIIIVHLWTKLFKNITHNYSQFLHQLALTVFLRTLQLTVQICIYKLFWYEPNSSSHLFMHVFLFILYVKDTYIMHLLQDAPDVNRLQCNSLHQ